MELLESHNAVLIIYEGSDSVSNFIENLKNKPNEVTSLQANDLVKLQPSSKYDFVFSGVVAPHDVRHDGSLLSSILKAAKPGAKIVVRQAVKQAAGNTQTSNQLITQLKLSGFTKISELRTITLSDDEKKSLQEKLNIPEQIEVIEVDCHKPNFEVGSSAQLKLKPKSDVSAVWKLEDTVDDDVETIDPDNLLDDEDTKKPDAPLKVCSTTGKRKACKDCSCGLAEELQSEQGAALEQQPKSSCGSCYLGDAFRCATCPYLGMPAFKPGEKIQLSSQQMQADT